MRNKVCSFFILAAGIVLSGISIGYGVAIGMAIDGFVRNPTLRDQILEILRTGLIVNLIPFALLIITSCICKCSRCCKNHDKRCD